jgi:hypothetical protein
LRRKETPTEAGEKVSVEAYLPCFMCGKPLLNEFIEADNQPREGTEFRTYGHYGSTFWDSFDGEELVLNVCDYCLRKHTDRLGQQKRYQPVRCEGFVGLGQRWVDRPMVAYTGNRDDSELKVEAEELGTAIPHVEWVRDIAERKDDIIQHGGVRGHHYTITPKCWRT